MFERDDADKARGNDGILDRDFIAQHTHGFEEFETNVRGHGWPELEIGSGLKRAAMEAVAAVYARANAAIVAYGMGMTQHVNGVENVQMVVNLLLMRGNIGKPGAGVLPIRGHSNVQGQRTVGITEKPELVPNDKLEALYGFTPPKEKGLNCTETAQAVMKGDVRAVFQLGGNLVRSLPDLHRLVPAWRRLRLTVQIETKLNKSCLVHGEVSYILPCLGRIELDEQGGREQAVSVEDSTACIHGSRGYATPASAELRSEPWIIAALAKAVLPRNPKVDWDGWVADYSRIRDAIERTYPEMFEDFNKRMWQPGGFHRPLAACRREWKTKSGKANFIVPQTLTADIKTDPARNDIFQLTTFRSQGQFNTTIYSDRDRFAGCPGHPDGSFHEPKRHSSARAERRRHRRAQEPRLATMLSAASMASSFTPTTFRKDASAATIRNAIPSCRCGIMPRAALCRRRKVSRSSLKGPLRIRHRDEFMSSDRLWGASGDAPCRAGSLAWQCAHACRANAPFRKKQPLRSLMTDPHTP